MLVPETAMTIKVNFSFQFYKTSHKSELMVSEDHYSS